MAIGMQINKDTLGLAMAVFDVHEDRAALANEIENHYLVIGDTLPGLRGAGVQLMTSEEFHSTFYNPLPKGLLHFTALIMK